MRIYIIILFSFFIMNSCTKSSLTTNSTDVSNLLEKEKKSSIPISSSLDERKRIANKKLHKIDGFNTLPPAPPPPAMSTVKLEIVGLQGTLNASLKDEMLEIKQDGIYPFQKQYLSNSTDTINIKSPEGQTCNISPKKQPQVDSDIIFSVACSKTTYPIILTVIWNVSHEQKLEVTLNDKSVKSYSGLVATKTLTDTVANLEEGSSYALSWTKNPVFICAVEQNSKIVTKEENKILMTCSENSYSLRVNTNGLTEGESIVLSLSSDNSLTINEGDVSKSFTKTFYYGESFDLTSSKLASPALTCTASPAKGVIDENPVVTLTCSKNTYKISGKVTFEDQAPDSLDILFNGDVKSFNKNAESTSIPFEFDKIAYNSPYTVEIKDVELTCDQKVSSNLTGDTTNLEIKCTRSTIGKIFSAVQNGSDADLATLLNDSKNSDIMDFRIPSVGKYERVTRIVNTDTKKETSVYLYSKYLLTQSSLDNTKIHTKLNQSLEKLILNSLKGDVTKISEYFTESNNDITNFFVYDKDLTGAIPDAIGNLTALTKLTLGGNPLTSIPDTIGNLTALTELTLDNNQLTSIPVEIGNLTALKHLHLGGNQLTSIPDAIGNLTGLQLLALDSNKLSSIPAAIGNLTGLINLYLSNNQLTSIPDTIGNLTALTELTLSYNQLTSIPDAIGKLTALKHLHLANNPSLKFPDDDAWKTFVGKITKDF